MAPGQAYRTRREGGPGKIIGEQRKGAVNVSGPLSLNSNVPCNPLCLDVKVVQIRLLFLFLFFREGEKMGGGGGGAILDAGAKDA